MGAGVGAGAQHCPDKHPPSCLYFQGLCPPGSPAVLRLRPLLLSSDQRSCLPGPAVRCPQATWARVSALSWVFTWISILRWGPRHHMGPPAPGVLFLPSPESPCSTCKAPPTPEAQGIGGCVSPAPYTAQAFRTPQEFLEGRARPGLCSFPILSAPGTRGWAETTKPGLGCSGIRMASCCDPGVPTSTRFRRYTLAVSCPWVSCVGSALLPVGRAGIWCFFFVF